MTEDEKIARRKRANEVRLNAVRQKARKTDDRRALISDSFKNLDGNVKSRKATHIQFSDSDESEIETIASKSDAKLARPNADKILGFDSEDSNAEPDVALKPQFQGKAGEKLLELQSSYGNDTRFRLDERFKAEGGSDSESSSEKKACEKENKTYDDTVKSEMETNMKVLGQVIGHQISTNKHAEKKAEKFIDISSRRYDPTKDGHLEVQDKIKERNTPRKKKKKKGDKPEDVQTDPRRFFEASTNTLKNAFVAKQDKDNVAAEKEEPFSFLSMLGRPKDSDSDDVAANGKVENKAENRLSEGSSMDWESGKKGIPGLRQTFQYDSSETDEEDEDQLPHVAGEKERTESRLASERTEGKDWPRTFFLSSPRDPRIVEGVRNFCWNKPFERIQREWLEVKDTLIKDYKKKHRDAKRKERRAKYEARQFAVANEP